MQDFRTEGEVTALAESSVGRTVNTGIVGGHFGLIPRPRLLSLTCQVRKRLQ